MQKQELGFVEQLHNEKATCLYSFFLKRGWNGAGWQAFRAFSAAAFPVSAG